ncbi:glycosyltransferase family 4 protein [Vibrio sp. WXL103]|uniref:glycosyltransferase family 4 protein n=1 Tax=Vibrio sp. WXL103 TaxID=3450710 RepID=UPI003EC5A599
MKNAKTRHVIVFDPIPFHGGSKVATRHAMEQTRPDIHYHVLSASAESWRVSQAKNIFIQQLIIPTRLANQTQGKGYWLKQMYLLLWLMAYTLCVALCNISKPDKLLLASGPGVDFAGYVFAHLTGLSAVQLVHGSVGASRVSRWCVAQGHKTFYLDSAQQSLQALFDHQTLPEHFEPFVNGLPGYLWPQQVKPSAFDSPHLFWAASLLKWKGLDLLIDTLKSNQLNQQLSSTICYIRPQKTTAEITKAPVSLPNCHWHESPNNLDDLRALANIYVSTSQQEPFGLSTLEAMAAGLIVVIPADGAYWDRHLQHEHSCLKYQTGDVNDLNRTLTHICDNLKHYKNIGINGQKIAEKYRAEVTYRAIACALEQPPNSIPTKATGELS